MTQVKEIIRLIRPMQWIKNAFVFVGLIFGMIFDDPELFMRVFATAVAFCLVSSSMYVTNDILDRERDQFHPVKKNRPLAKGTVSVPTAIVLAIVLGIAGLLLGFWVSRKVLMILAIYVLLNVSYSAYLKNVVIIDVFCISTGFMLRLLAGTVGVGIPPSRWLVLCGLMVTLFLGFAKRRAELLLLSQHKGDHRKVLVNYQPIFLDEILSICVTGVIITYSLYTMSPSTVELHQTENLIFTVPFIVYALFRYLYLLHNGTSGGDPTYDIIKDPHIVLSVICWAGFTFFLLK